MTQSEISRSSAPLFRLALGHVAIWALVSFGTPPSAAAAPLFGAQFLSFDVGNTPQSVAIADLNGDGKLDLVTGNKSANTASVLLGNGDGTFGQKTDFAAGSGPYSVAIADLNGDGKLDLAVANGSANTVSVLLGNGNGTFGQKTDFATGSSPTSVAIADLNGDAKPDLVLGNNSSSTVSVLLGNGNGTFGVYTQFATRSNSTIVAIADLNGDGKLDLAAINYITPSTVSVLLGNGDGTFGQKTDFATGSYPTSVAIGDLNGDGKLDLVTAQFLSNTVSVLLGIGDGTFGPKTDFVGGNHPYSVAIADLDGDGKLDLVTSHYNSNSVSVLLGNGNGTFGPMTDFATGGASYCVAIGDLNGDGRLDLVTANHNANTVSVLINTGAGCSGTITVTQATGGTITPVGVAGVVTVNCGTDQTFTITPDASYSILDVLVDGASVGARTSYTFYDVVANHTIAASFGLPPIVTATGVENGVVYGDAGRLLSIEVVASDPDGDPITDLYSVDDTPAGNQARFLTVPGFSLGTWTWTPRCVDRGVFHVTFTARNSLTGSTTIEVRINQPPDIDGDGLPDAWETGGIPMSGGGSYLLPGANPLHKDVYVEVDAMQGWAPDQADLQRVVDAFAASPVCNPDGQSGITLHILGPNGCDPCVDDADLGAGPWPTNTPTPGNAGLWDAIAELKTRYFGTESERLPGAGLPTPVFEARAKAVRYCVFGESFGNGGNSGVTQGSNRDNFVVTLAPFSNHGYDADYGYSVKRAGTFMHELGHSLGLDHGGREGDETNYKPNYYSVMNYTWQWPAFVREANKKNYRKSWSLDYSRSKLNRIDEKHVNEYLGIGGNFDADDLHYVPVGPLKNGRARVVNMNGPVDFDGEHGIVADVQIDLSWVTGGSSPDQILEPFEDWNNLRLVTNANRPHQALAMARGGLASDTTDAEEMTQAIYDSLSALRFDCNGNGIEDAEEIANGTVADLNDNGIPDPCEAAAILLAVGGTPSPRSEFTMVVAPRGATHEIRYSLPARAQTRLRVFDLTGRVVATLTDGDAAAGVHRVVWGHVDAGGRAVSSGVYFLELQSGSRRAQGKVVVLR